MGRPSPALIRIEHTIEDPAVLDSQGSANVQLACHLGSKGWGRSVESADLQVDLPLPRACTDPAIVTPSAKTAASEEMAGQPRRSSSTPSSSVSANLVATSFPCPRPIFDL